MSTLLMIIGIVFCLVMAWRKKLEMDGKKQGNSRNYTQDEEQYNESNSGQTNYSGSRSKNGKNFNFEINGNYTMGPDGKFHRVDDGNTYKNGITFDEIFDEETKRNFKAKFTGTGNIRGNFTGKFDNVFDGNLAKNIMETVEKAFQNSSDQTAYKNTEQTFRDDIEDEERASRQDSK